jgi:small nuclear ribonucleoprotein (snRNP)-like protein
MGMALMEASRKFMAELSSLIDKKVKVILNNGKWYEGILAAFEHPSLNLLLKDVVDNEGKKHPKVIISGGSVSEILAVEIPLFDPEDFRRYILEKLKNLKEHQVEIPAGANVVVIMRKYKVSEKGVEGSGPFAEILYELFEKYMEERKKLLQG